jgi:hypothetical protein
VRPTQHSFTEYDFAVIHLIDLPKMPQPGFFRISPTIRLFDRHALFVNKVFTVLDLRFAQARDRIAQIGAANPHLRDEIRGELQKLRQIIDPRWTGASY